MCSCISVCTSDQLDVVKNQHKIYVTATTVGVSLCEEGQGGCGMWLQLGFSMLRVI